jgi:hypothetical protein
MALAPLIYTIWNLVMCFDLQNPIWPNHDRLSFHWPLLDVALVHSPPLRRSGSECRLSNGWATVGDVGRHPPLSAITGMSCNCAISRPHWYYRANLCQRWIGSSMLRHPDLREGLMCWNTRLIENLKLSSWQSGAN